MIEEHRITRGLVLTVLIAILVVGGLAYLDITGQHNKILAGNSKEADAIFPFKWSYKMCDEVYIDSLGHRVRVVSQSNSTYTCERRDEHRNCTAWTVKVYTNPTIAYMKGWKDADRQELNTHEYTYDSLGRPIRVIVRENMFDTNFKFVRDRAIKYDGKGRVIEMLTNNYTFDEALGSEQVRYTYYDNKVDSIIHKINRDGRISQHRVSCRANYQADPSCYYGPNPTFEPHSIVELIYEHLATTDRDLYEKFEFVDSFPEGRLRTLKYCHEEDYSWAIRNALPKSNYPLEEK